MQIQERVRQSSLPLRVKMNLMQGFGEAVRKYQVEKAYRQLQRERERERKVTMLQDGEVLIRRHRPNA